MRGLDYAGGIPPAAAISAAGYRFVVRYLTPGGPALPGKLLTPSEYASLITAGVAVTVNFETNAIRMKDGHDAGVADARTADAAVRKIGHPTDKPIYFSADWDTTPADQVAIDAYLRGVAEVIGFDRVGVYGSYYVVKRCLDNGTARWAWQTLAWSGGHTDPRAHIFQRIGTVFIGGVPCDINESNADYFGQHIYTPPTALGVDMPAGEWVTTVTPVKHKVTFPVGPKSSSLIARGWLSIEPDQPANLDVTVRGGGEVLARWTETVPADRRWWKELPDGTEGATVLIATKAPGVAGWCLELKASV